MTWKTISEHSKVTPADIAGMFGAISSKICEKSDVIVFASTFGRVVFEEDHGTITRMNFISNVDVGGGTEAWKPMEHARQMKAKYDRVFMFSDMQCYSDIDNSFAKSFLLYQREVAPAFLYSVDLMGYGTAQVPTNQDKVILLSGFSEKLFDFIPKFETSRESLIQDIEGYIV
jgi:hypothetical protein